MVSEELFVQIKKLQARPGRKVNLSQYPTDYNGDTVNKQTAAALLEAGRKNLALIQEKLYAHNRYSVLIILQAMDTAGKDSAIKHILSGMNPLSVKVHSFKAPTSHELDHDFFWRHNLALPARGEIAIHNRSHYENVLVTRVHPELILNEHLPGVERVEQIDKSFWERRFEQINRYEKNLAQNNMVILKFYLHLSKNEQKKRLLERIDDPAKHWKFAFGDLRERALWNDYKRAYEEAIAATTQDYAPWFIIPADDKWFARLAIAAVINRRLASLPLDYPRVSAQQEDELRKAREILMAEKDEGKKTAGKSPHKTSRKTAASKRKTS